MFIRVISELKRWSRIEGKESSLPADCFFDIKTTKNTLSLWKIEGDEQNFNQFVVISTLGRASLSKISYVLIKEEDIEAQGLQYMHDMPGCPYINENDTEFISHHYDIINISQDEYLKIANIIISKIENKQIHIMSLEEVKNVVKQLTEKGLIYTEKLQSSMQQAISKIQKM